MTDGYYGRVKEAADAVAAKAGAVPDVAVVLGSGLGDFAGTLGAAVSMPYQSLPHWPESRPQPDLARTNWNGLYLLVVAPASTS